MFLKNALTGMGLSILLASIGGDVVAADTKFTLEWVALSANTCRYRSERVELCVAGNGVSIQFRGGSGEWGPEQFCMAIRPFTTSSPKLYPMWMPGFEYQCYDSTTIRIREHGFGAAITLYVPQAAIENLTRGLSPNYRAIFHKVAKQF